MQRPSLNPDCPASACKRRLQYSGTGGERERQRTVVSARNLKKTNVHHDVVLLVLDVLLRGAPPVVFSVVVLELVPLVAVVPRLCGPNEVEHPTSSSEGKGDEREKLW